MTKRTQAYAAKEAGVPSAGLALAIVGVTFCVYFLFNYNRYGEELYLWSKTLASFDYRQHLGMSKRWAMQYGHIVFLFVILLMSKYIFVSDRSNGKLSRLLSRIVPYTLPVFMIHFPLLYFFAALTGHDPADPLDQAFLFFAVLVTSLAFGKLCFLTKPAFDRLQKRGAALIEQQVPGAQTERPPAAMSGALPHRR